MYIANTFNVSLEWIFDPQVLQFFRNLISRKKTGKRDRITSTTSSADVSQYIMFLTSQLSTYTVASQVAKTLQLPLSTREDSADDDPLLYNNAHNWSRLFAWKD